MHGGEGGGGGVRVASLGLRFGVDNGSTSEGRHTN